MQMIFKIQAIILHFISKIENMMTNESTNVLLNDSLIKTSEISQTFRILLQNKASIWHS